MTSSQIRQSFLDFFKSKQHTIVPSSSLMPDSPNLLFTNAGMNQFVPIFLGQTQCPYTPGRAADTQKCIRAGGKHNDLEDVGLDTYHHTFFEMLGNWSFGDYFKKEAIAWAWELVVEKWGFPADRLYATVFCPHMDMDEWQKELKWAVEFAEDRRNGIHTEFGSHEREGVGKLNYSDCDAASFWADHFIKAGQNPFVHIVPGNRKDNFWMMGETGPCGPCSELHVDLTPEGNTEGKLVNKGDARCMEIWNLVFIEFNAEPGNKFSLLPSCHVDTGMGFERVTSIIQGTKGFSDFKNAKISNYETDIFRPIFDALEKLSGKKYGSTLPGSAGILPASSIPGTETRRQDAGAPGAEQVALDIAFRVIADHIRTLSFAIADGIQPGNTDRNYVLRRILRRAVRYGRTLGFHEPFFYKLVDVLADTMGEVFPEIRARKKQVQETIRTEEEAFNKTLDNGIKIFRESVQWIDAAEKAKRLTQMHLQNLQNNWSEGFVEGDTYSTLLGFARELAQVAEPIAKHININTTGLFQTSYSRLLRMSEPDEIAAHRKQREVNLSGFTISLEEFDRSLDLVLKLPRQISGQAAFTLYDTYGFPLDLTQLMAREIRFDVDGVGFETLMEEQRTRARAAQKKEVISLSQIETTTPTMFVGFENLAVQAKVLEVVSLKDKTAIILDTSACYAEMGGQVGDTGELTGSGQLWRITNTQKSGNTWLHLLESERRLQSAALPHKSGVPQLEDTPLIGSTVTLNVDQPRRNAIQRHHTVTHLLHWALHEVVSKEASQKGSFVGPDKLTFDFNSAPLTPTQVADIEKLVNERILENAGVSWTEVPHADVKSRKDVMQFFGDKYGDTVRVVQIGGRAAKLDGYSMELCGGTHTRATGEIGLFRIVGENAIAAGVRRIEAIAGLTAYDVMKLDRELIKTVAGKVNSPIHELEKKIESLLEQQKALEKQVKTAMQRNASNAASELLTLATTVNGIPVITHNLGEGDGDYFQAVADALKGRFKGVVVLGGGSAESVSLVATVSAEFTGKIMAGKIIQAIAPIVGGKGGGKPDNARGGGKDASKLDEALAKARSLL